MDKIEIEHGVPLLSRSATPRPRFPFEEMKVGDSFIVGLGDCKSWSFLFSAMQYASRKHDRKFSTRLIENGQRRVWRIA